MKIVRILDWPLKRYYGESHLFYRWKNLLGDLGLKVSLHYDHNDPAVKDADCLIIHSRYFKAWQNTATRNPQNQEELLAFLCSCKYTVNRLIWFDAADSTGSADFLLLPYVDIFLKKQMLKNKNYYTQTEGYPNLRPWLPSDQSATACFTPCDSTQLDKMRLAWNVGMDDFRYYGYKMSRLSNFLGHQLYPLKFSSVLKERPIDAVFRGKLHQSAGAQNQIARQRNEVLTVFNDLKRNIAKGPGVPKRIYWRELRNSKVGVSPFGFGEICHRDFETFISGGLLVKPDMEHMETFPNWFIKDETYISVDWQMTSLKTVLEAVLDNYPSYLHIAIRGQANFKKHYMDGEGFATHFKKAIS